MRRIGVLFLSRATAPAVTGYSWLGPPGPMPRDVVSSLLNRARALQRDYDAALRNFIGLGKWAYIIDAIGNLEGLPLDFLGEWERTGQYSNFSGLFATLFDECSGTLSGIVGARGSPLAVRLRAVAEAVQLETKLRRLVTCLETASTEELRFKSESRTRKRSDSSARSRPVAPGGRESFAYTVLGMMIAILALCLGVSISVFGVPRGAYVGIGTGVVGLVAVWATRHLWVTRLVHAFSAK